MRLLVITTDRELAGMFFGQLPPEFSVEYFVQPSGAGVHLWEKLPGGEDAVILFAWEEEFLADIVSGLRSMLSVPLVVCSTKPGSYQEVQCLQCGADDYLGMPCQEAVFSARVQRLARLYRGWVSGAWMHRELWEDPDAGQFYYGDMSMCLTRKEYQVMYWLVHSQEEIISKEKLLYHIWGQDTKQACRALDTIIKQLRHKLSGMPVSIRTHYGRGYSLVW